MTANDAPIKVAFVGYGYTHRTFHLPAILLCPEYVVHAFVQRKEFPIDKRTGKPGPSCVDDYPKAIRYRSMEDMLKDEEVELVVVVTPGESHAELCIQALEAGKNGKWSQDAQLTVVIVEKPFCMGSAEADKVLAAAEKSGKLLSVFQSESHHS
jgi:scyllo-inositol 2-dehydrogenase (NADP+)